MAHEPLEKLRRDCDLAVNLVVLDGTDAVYIEQFESAGLARNFRESGRRASAHTTSSGKCLLAFADPNTVDALVASGLRGSGPRAITSESALREVLDSIRSDGFVVTVEERTKAVTSIGAPIFGRTGQCIAAVSIVGPSMLLGGDDLNRYVRLVGTCALRIGRAMGYSGAGH